MPEKENQNSNIKTNPEGLEGSPNFDNSFDSSKDTTDPYGGAYNQNRFTEFNPQLQKSDYNPNLEEDASDDQQSMIDRYRQAKGLSDNIQSKLKNSGGNLVKGEGGAATKAKSGAKIGGLIARAAVFLFTNPIGWIILAILAVVLIVFLILLFLSLEDEGKSPVSQASNISAAECKGKTDQGFYNTAEAKKIYGNPDTGAVQSQLVTVDFMGKKVKFHAKAAGCLQNVVEEIKKTKPDYKIKLIGTFANRSKRGGSTKSMHSFGIAMDINWDQNPFCYCTTHDMPPEWVAAFKNNGFNWGGDWRRKKDWMHFEYHGLPVQ